MHIESMCLRGIYAVDRKQLPNQRRLEPVFPFLILLPSRLPFLKALPFLTFLLGLFALVSAIPSVFFGFFAFVFFAAFLVSHVG